MREEESVARRFVEAINSHDLSAVGALMSDDHTFVDSLGRTLQGRQAVLEAWPHYLAWFPDYSIEVTHIVASGATVAIFGSASGTLSRPALGHSSWRIPAAWRATVLGGRVSEWQVYADNKPVDELLSRAAEPG